MNQELIQAFSADYILDNLGIAYIYAPKRGVIKEGKGVRELENIMRSNVRISVLELKI